MKQLSKKNNWQSSIEERKKKLQDKLSKHLSSINTPTKLEIIEKIMAPISPTVAAATAVNRSETNFHSSHVVNTNKKIAVQRRLWSTKRHKKVPAKSFKKPSAKESQTIAVQLLQPITFAGNVSE